VLAHPQNGIGSGEIAVGLTAVFNCLAIVKYEIRMYGTNEENQNTRYKRVNQLTVIKIRKTVTIIVLKHNKI
jgi:hypothetical protein